MKLEAFKTLWGVVGVGTPSSHFEGGIPAIAEDDFDGVSFALIARRLELDIGTLQQFQWLCDGHALGVATLVQTLGDSVGEHFESLESEFERPQWTTAPHLPRRTERVR